LEDGWIEKKTIENERDGVDEEVSLLEVHTKATNGLAYARDSTRACKERGEISLSGDEREDYGRWEREIIVFPGPLPSSHQREARAILGDRQSGKE
jgi:hypothetical protein